MRSHTRGATCAELEFVVEVMTRFPGILFVFAQECQSYFVDLEIEIPLHQGTIYLDLTVAAPCSMKSDSLLFHPTWFMCLVKGSSTHLLITNLSSLIGNVSTWLSGISAENIWWHLHLLCCTGGDQSAGERHGDDAADQWEDQQHGAEASQRSQPSHQPSLHAAERDCGPSCHGRFCQLWEGIQHENTFWFILSLLMLQPAHINAHISIFSFTLTQALEAVVERN